MTAKDESLRQAREALLKARWETQAGSEVDLAAESAIASIDAALSEKAEAVAPIGYVHPRRPEVGKRGLTMIHPEYSDYWYWLCQKIQLS